MSPSLDFCSLNTTQDKNHKKGNKLKIHCDKKNNFQIYLLYNFVDPRNDASARLKLDLAARVQVFTTMERGKG